MKKNEISKYLKSHLYNLSSILLSNNYSMSVPKIVTEVSEFIKSKDHACMKINNGILTWCQKDVCEATLSLKRHRVALEFAEVLEKRKHSCVLRQEPLPILVLDKDSDLASLITPPDPIKISWCGKRVCEGPVPKYNSNGSKTKHKRQKVDTKNKSNDNVALFAHKLIDENHTCITYQKLACYNMSIRWCGEEKCKESKI